MQSGEVDLTINIPVRDVARLNQEPTLAAEINPITRVILLQIRNDLGFADPSHFARFCRKQTGTTPQQFREGRGG